MTERWYNPATGRPLGNADNVNRMRKRAGSSDGFLPVDLDRLAMAQPRLLERAPNAGCAIDTRSEEIQRDTTSPPGLGPPDPAALKGSLLDLHPTSDLRDCYRDMVQAAAGNGTLDLGQPPKLPASVPDVDLIQGGSMIHQKVVVESSGAQLHTHSGEELDALGKLVISEDSGQALQHSGATLGDAPPPRIVVTTPSSTREANAPLLSLDSNIHEGVESDDPMES